jgi:hypothetical protein
MRTDLAFEMGRANRDRELMVFDWDKAARLIVEHEASEAGLAGDWEWTGGTIFSDGRPIPKEETYVYLSSTWATPEIDIDGIIYTCFLMHSEVPLAWLEDNDDPAHIYWPESALQILQNRGS